MTSVLIYKMQQLSIANRQYVKYETHKPKMHREPGYEIANGIKILYR